jgi:hypothetical protein
MNKSCLMIFDQKRIKQIFELMNYVQIFFSLPDACLVIEILPINIPFSCALFLSSTLLCILKSSKIYSLETPCALSLVKNHISTSAC